MDRLPIDEEPPDVFSYSAAIGYEEGVARRDPSPVIEVGETYHVWYAKASADAPAGCGSIAHATSVDGRHWVERDAALAPGVDGAWDCRGVSSPTILIAQGRYWLYYVGVGETGAADPDGASTSIGVAAADSPDGPWERVGGEPVLRPGEENLPDVQAPGDGRLTLWPSAEDVWDNQSVCSPCLVVRGGRYFLYYRGRQRGQSPEQSRIGLAVAADPGGPFDKHKANPLLDAGGEVCVWPQRRGVAALLAPVGPEGGTLQYSSDGVRFTRQAQVVPPVAPGPFRADGYQSDAWGKGITWGLCHNVTSRPAPFLMRFDCDLRAVEW